MDHTKWNPDVILGPELWVHAVDPQTPNDAAMLFVQKDLCTVAACSDQVWSIVRGMHACCVMHGNVCSTEIMQGK